MIEKLKTILNIPERYYALLISKTSNGANYQLIEVRFKDNEFKIENRFYSKDFENIFKENLNKNYPLILHVEGENIINKCVEKKPGYRKNIIFKADPNEFHFFEYHQNDNIFISVSRKLYIDEWIKKIRDAQFYVIHVSFGPFVMANIMSIAKIHDVLSSPIYNINIKDNKILSFNNSNPLAEKKYDINGDVFNQFELPLLAAFLDFKYPNPNIEFDRAFLLHNKNEVIFKKWFKIAGIFILGFFLLTLPLSHYLMGQYINSIAEKEYRNVISQQTIMQVNALEEEKSLKEKILLSSGINKKKFLTKYMVDIGNTVPQTIILNAIAIIPPSKKIRETEKIKFDINTINISGACQNNKAFSDWLKQLEKLSWIKKIDIEDYSQETRLENLFTISIQI